MQPSLQDDQVILEGAISVDAALRSGSREIFRIVIRDGKSESAIESMAARSHVTVDRVDAAEIDALAAGASHGGVIAVAGPRKFAKLDDLVQRSQSAPGSNWLVMIDGVEDPYNFGAAVRSIFAAGSSGLVVRPRNWFTAAAVVARSSAGATERIPTAIAETAEAAATFFHGHGYVIACADESPDAVDIYDADLTRPLFLLIGGEKRGITRSFRDQADLALRIPYGAASAHSLGTAAAAAVIAFEILRQRRFHDSHAAGGDREVRRKRS